MSTNNARAWRGHWIGAPEPEREIEAGPQFHAQVGGAFARDLYRRTVGLKKAPETAPLRITADSRYVLYVNGVEAGRGPVRSQPRRLRYDRYDIAPLLHDGDNVLVVLVTYYGTANAFWQPSAVNEHLGHAGVLVVEADLGTETLVSDESWEMRPADAWSAPAQHGLDGVPVEIVDAGRLEPGWRSGAGDGWRPVQIKPAGHLGSLARSQPPTDPYGALLERPIGPLGGPRVEPIAAAVGGVTERPIGESPVGQVLDAWPEIGNDMAAAGPGAVTVEAGKGQGRGVEYDFGRVVVGFVQFTVDAPAGTTVDLLYREKPADPADTFVMSVPRIGARYIARGHDDVFEAQEVNGFRYAHLVITPPTSATVTVRGFAVREHLYPEAGDAFFASSDPELDRLYTAGRRTVAVNAADAFTDCPTREQRAWVGDGVVHEHVHLTTSTDWRLARWYVELGNSPRPDGILPMSVVGEIEHSQQHTIPDWSLNWVHGVHLLHRYDPGAAALVRDALPTVRRILAWYLPYLTGDGVLADIPEWNLVDWSSILLGGASSIITALWARALTEYTDINRHLGNAAEADWAGELWERVRQGFGVFFDGVRGTYVDQVVDGVRQTPASQLAGATAILAGLVPEAEAERVLAWISDRDRLVVRSWIGGAGGYDTAKIIDQLKGVQRIDWDAETQVVQAQPFASYHVHDAYRQCGRPDLIVDGLRQWTPFLHDGYDTFGECWGWGTPAHGWSSTPTRDLITAVLGVTPAEPGFAVARIAPAYGLLDEMSGAVPTPYGLLRVSVRGDQAAVDSPIPYRLVRPDGSIELGGGR